jgi:hypothetical protein
VKDNGETRVDEIGYLPLWVYKPQTKKGTLFTLVPAAAGETAFRMSPDDVARMRQFLEDTRLNLAGIREVEPALPD